nr:MAG TPA_asm: hypothetical protein [Caudoviricetes sp.]
MAAGVNDGIGASPRRHTHKELAGEGGRDRGLADGLKLVLDGEGVIAGQTLEIEIQLVEGLPLIGKGFFQLEGKVAHALLGLRLGSGVLVVIDGGKSVGGDSGLLGVSHDDNSFQISKRCPEQVSRPGRWPGLLHTERLADVGQVVGAVDIADEVQLVDLAHLLAVDVSRPVADGVLAGAVGGRCGGDGAALVALWDDHKNMLDGAHDHLAGNDILVLLRNAQVDGVAAGLGELHALVGDGAEVEAQRHRVEVAEDDRLHIAGNAGTGDRLRQRGQVGQRRLGHADILHGIFVDLEVDNALIHDSNLLLALQGAGDIAGVILQHEVDLLSGGGRRHVDTEFDDAGHKVGQRVLTLQHLHASAQDVANTHQAVEPDVGGIENGVDEAAGHGLVQLAPEGADHGVSDPAKHPGDGDKVILDVGVAGIAGGIVAPGAPAAHEVQRGQDAVVVEDVRLCQSQIDFGAILQDHRIALEALVAGGLIGAAAVVGVHLGHQARQLRAHVELVVPELEHGPAGNLVHIDEVLPALLGDGRGIAGGAGGAGVDVDQRLGLEHPVDAAGLGRHDGGHDRGLGVPGGADQVGHDAQRGHAQLNAFHPRSNSGIVHRRGLDLVVGHVDLRSGIGLAVGQRLNDKKLPVVVGAVIGVLDVGIAGAARGLDDQIAVVDGLDGQLGLMVGQGHIGCGHCLLHVRGIKDVAEDDRLAAEQLEVGIRKLTERIAGPVVRVAQLLHSLGPAGAESRDADSGGRRRALHGGRADDKGDSALGHDGGADAGRLLGDVYAMICHSASSLLSAGGQLLVVHIQQVSGGLDFDAILGERVAGDNQRGDQRVSFQGRSQLTEHISFAAPIDRAGLDYSPDAGAEVDAKPGGLAVGFLGFLGGLGLLRVLTGALGGALGRFFLYYCHSATSLSTPGTRQVVVISPAK